MSASKPAAEPQIAAASHRVGRRSWHTLPSTHPPALCSHTDSFVSACLVVGGLLQAQTAIATTTTKTAARYSDPRPPRQTRQACNLTWFCTCADMVSGRVKRQSSLDTGKTRPATPLVDDRYSVADGRGCGDLSWSRAASSSSSSEDRAKHCAANVARAGVELA